ncbi:uncharacterized protein LOC126839332 [Adelges cooleyi]|uniref:uncharacterized protein LOC126839332 n=1 Tax=Adelges cooleyi TaxID=133065 RepID=UPI00217FD7EB|nr:uncharacterized protein LOC126839332 [Adelges cooleyi]
MEGNGDEKLFNDHVEDIGVTLEAETDHLGSLSMADSSSTSLQSVITKLILSERFKPFRNDVTDENLSDEEDPDELLLRVTDSMSDTLSVEQSNYFAGLRECVGLRRRLETRNSEDTTTAVSSIQASTLDCSNDPREDFDLPGAMAFLQDEFDVVLPNINGSLEAKFCDPSFDARTAAIAYLQDLTKKMVTDSTKN